MSVILNEVKNLGRAHGDSSAATQLQNDMRIQNATIGERQQQVLCDQKWMKFLKRARLFQYIPFVDFALGAGSMATGKVHRNSDFDVIVGAHTGRIFTARFCSIALFGLFGWRRKKLSHTEDARDKVCLNHFVTRDAFTLSPPYNSYWQDLYRNLAPLYGSSDAITAFFRANEGWAGEVRGYADDLRYRYRAPARVTRAIERLLSRGAGDAIERMLKTAQVRRIEHSIAADPPGYKPRIVYTESELEFHPDTRRIEEYGE